MKFFIFSLFFVAIFSVDYNKDIPTFSKLRFKYGNHTINKPKIHFNPEYGWMNDPNGCWYDEKKEEYHLYFQYNPANSIWEMPLYWGHAISKNLVTWEEKGIAIQPINKVSGAYSGSVFLDTENIFGVFPSDTEGQNVIAAWTYTAADWYEYQYLSYSLDDGITFVTPDEDTGENGLTNPAITTEKTSKEFRDPQVIKVAPGTYIMSVARSHEYQIEFYKATSSTNKKFVYFGKFGLIGYLGYQYECPNLVHLKNNGGSTLYNKDSYWVLFISINPGSIQGGSSTQYFIGTFNYSDTTNKPFTVDDYRTTVIDYGKDFYAMQLFFKAPVDVNGFTQPFDNVTGIGWASNWQYTALVPTDPWRSSMSIPRAIKLGVYQPATADPDPSPELLYVLQKPLINYTLFDTATDDYVTQFTYEGATEPINANNFIPGNYFYHADLSKRAGGTLEFELEFEFVDVYTNDKPGVINIFLNGTSVPGEYLKIGYNNKADAFFIDRGNTNVQWCKNNPFFTDKVNVNLYSMGAGDSSYTITKTICTDISENGEKTYTPKEESGKRSLFKVYGLIDMNILELFFNQDDDKFSVITSTNTFFFTGGNFIDSIDIKIDDNTNQGFYIKNFKARQLNLK